MTVCANNEKERLLNFLDRRPSENCFPIGDIENFNLNENFIDVWILETDRRITSVLLRYYRYYVVYCENNNNIRDICLQIKKDKDCLTVVGIEDIIDKISGFLPMKEIKREYLAELNRNNFTELQTEYKPVKAVESDTDELFEFHKSIEEFKATEDNRESFGKEIISNTGRIYYCREKGKIVSSATLTAENSTNGMIIGVATAPEFRRKGYAKTCMNALCKL